ncbi:transmembrane protein 53 [Schistocerca cancellata]|uniref:transmembrane protein 53 n=1 Tax=Schistocerca cancellata TaxID=274614 RepID=UPI0021191FC6|nr:transmembrane protein 53 [Schistocerca cancellata]XP_049765236.1 transmembrane protein 53 [Schistocerca cancellata]
MRLYRTALTVILKGTSAAGTTCVIDNNHANKFLLSAPNSALLLSFQRSYTTNELSKNLQLTSNDEVKIDKSFGFKIVSKPTNKPLVVLLPWLLAQQKHIMKYGRFYLDQGFDVLKVSLTPWQLLWPTKGSQLIAEDLLQFLHLNKFYQPLLLHGFSVGGYLWGEALVKIKQDMELYQPVVDRIAGHIWDSAADLTEMPVGFPKAVFPKNLVLQNAFEKYIRYHLKTFHQAATIHYIRSSQMFHTSIVRTPALLLFSKTDPIGCAESNLRVRDIWESVGMRVYTKCWDESPHVGHFRAHPQEYMAEIYAFLDKLNLVQNPERQKVQI